MDTKKQPAALLGFGAAALLGFNALIVLGGQMEAHCMLEY